MRRNQVTTARGLAALLLAACSGQADAAAGTEPIPGNHYIGRPGEGRDATQ